jgi:hypothetical protein
MDDAQKRVDDVVNRTRASVTQATDTARKAAAYLSFWTFIYRFCSAPFARRWAECSAAICATTSPPGVRFPRRRGNRDHSGTDRVGTRWQNERAAHGSARFP